MSSMQSSRCSHQQGFDFSSVARPDKAAFTRLAWQALALVSLLLLGGLFLSGRETALALTQGHFVYVNRNTTTNNVEGFSVAADGTLASIGVFPTGGFGSAAGFAAANRAAICVGDRLYVSNQTGVGMQANVGAFDINPTTGALTAVAGSPFATGGTAGQSLSLDSTPDGRFLIAANEGSNNITVFSIQANGALTPVAGSPFANPAGSGLAGVKITPDGRFLIAALNATDQVAVFGIGVDGTLTAVAGSPFASSATGLAAGIEINCAGTLLFVGQTDLGGSGTSVDVFNIGADGTLDAIPGSPFNFNGVGNNSSVVVLSPDNRFLFVSSLLANVIVVFNVAANGALTLVPGTPIANNPGFFPQQMTTNQAGTLLYVSNSSTVSVFNIPNDGVLTPVAGSPFLASAGNRPGIAAFPAAGCTPTTTPMPALTKAFDPTTVSVGQQSILTFTITNTPGNPAQSGLAFTETLPNGVTLAAAPTAAQCGGTVTGTAGGDTLGFSGGTLAPGAPSCLIVATVVASTTGAKTNTSANISGAAQLDASGVNATLTVNDACLATLSQPAESFAANGGAGSFNVQLDAGCMWTATTGSPFITITSPVGEQTGPGTVSYTVASHNNLAPRNGTIKVAGQNFTVRQGAMFLDVPLGHLFYTEIGKLSARGITLGCDASNFCPDASLKREQMAAFLSRALGVFNPPLPALQRFLDVLPNNLFFRFIEEIALRQITLGCGGGNFCPTANVTREQAAAFIIRALHEPGYTPPLPALQRFTDVPPANPFYAHIEEMAVRGVTLGCGGGNYCPAAFVTRAQMAAFLVRAFAL